VLQDESRRRNRQRVLLTGQETIMPILPLEPYLYPDDLFSNPAPPVGGPHSWWVLHTRPRAEKSLSRNCLGQRIPFFLPLCERHSRSRGRTLTAHIPLFPGYVFLLANEEARVEALTTNLVVNCLRVADQSELHGDLANVYRLMKAGMPVAPEERLLPGTTVQIVAGPLAGLQGKVVKKGKQFRFVVEVHFLQQGARVDIEGWMLEKNE
jgi:transcriptional antiterminator RfaH